MAYAIAKEFEQYTEIFRGMENKKKVANHLQVFSLLHNCQ